MSSKVYFSNFRSTNIKENKISKIKNLFEKAEFNNFIKENDLTAVKTHFGERGNDAFINPIFIRQIVDKIKEAKGKPFITDTNTLYKGYRSNAVDHLITAIEHGFNYSVVGAPLIISDGLKSKAIKEIEINKKHFKKVKIALDIANSDSMIVVSHFKGHQLAGFGGAIKNLAMGCSPAVGKMQQHSMRPKVDKKFCIGCRTCLENCPVEAIRMNDLRAIINKEICIGCGECMQVCPVNAIVVNWETDIQDFVERMTEYAYGAIKGKENKVGYINFVTNVTPDCDCVPWSDAPIVPDVGFLASKDPVALDKACLDLVNNQVGFKDSDLKHNHEKGKDKFKGIKDNMKGDVQLTYGEKIGLGNQEYDLIEI